MEFAPGRMDGARGSECKEGKKKQPLGVRIKGETTDEWLCLYEVLPSVETYSILEKGQVLDFPKIARSEKSAQVRFLYEAKRKKKQHYSVFYDINEYCAIYIIGIHYVRILVCNSKN